MHADTLNFREIIGFLVAPGVVVPVAHRFRISPVLAYLGAELATGRFGLARLVECAPRLAG